MPTTNKRKSALILLRLWLYGGRINTSYLYNTADEAGLRLLKSLERNQYVNFNAVLCQE